MVMIYTGVLVISIHTAHPSSSNLIGFSLLSSSSENFQVAPYSLTDSYRSLAFPLLVSHFTQIWTVKNYHGATLIRMIFIRFRRLASILKSFDKNITITTVLYILLVVFSAVVVDAIRLLLVANLIHFAKQRKTKPAGSL